MKTHPRILVLCLCAQALLLSTTHAKNGAAAESTPHSTTPPAASPVVQPHGQKVGIPYDSLTADASWGQLQRILQYPQGDSTAISTIEKADRARAFYQTHSKHSHAIEARKLEALLLLDAAAEGQKANDPRMQSAVKQFRDDTSIPASQRAIVVGTYEFQMARERIHSVNDMFREYEAVARRLMKEFPDQPQGYLSLLTQSTQREPAIALALAQEVAESSGPPEVRAQARLLVQRLKLVGKSIETLLGGSLPPNVSWQKNTPGVVYFWAPSKTESVLLGERLGRCLAQNVNVIGVCLDTNHAEGKSVAATHALPGGLVFAAAELLERLGELEAPLVCFVDGAGLVRDVGGSEDLEAKLSALGL